MNQFGYASLPFFSGISTVPQRVVGLPIQSPGVSAHYVAIPVEAVSPRIIPTNALINPLALAAHWVASWQTAPLYGGLPTYSVQGLPSQPFGVTQSFASQGLPVSQWGVQASPIQQALGTQVLQVPQAFGGLPIQTVGWGGQPAFDLSNALLGHRYEFLPTAPAGLVTI